ncbi:MAG: BatD family protein, partial [Flavobacteriaceae bacterium]
SRTITAGKRTLTVLPFPEEGKPTHFNGAVGAFELEVKTSKNTLNASESLQATVAVKGKGNLKLFSLPELVTPSALERYDPEYEEQVNTTLSGMEGYIKNTYTLVPQYQGKYPIPSVAFSYFDPKAKAYKTLNSEEIIIDVIEGPKARGTVSNTPNTATTDVTNPSNAFQFIAQRTNFTAITQQPFLGSKWFYALLMLPIVLVVLYAMLRKRKPDAALVAQRHNARLVKKYLGKAKRSMADSADFYVALEAALHNYVKARLHIQTSEFSKEKMEALLTEKGVDAQTVALFIRVLTNCEFARYTPSSRSSMEQDYATAVEAITQMDKQL